MNRRPPILVRRNNGNNGAGFTLIELLVAIGIIAVLMAVLIPVIGNARRAAQRVECMSNLRQLTWAWDQYHSMHGGHMAISAVHEVTNPGYFVSWVGGGADEADGIRRGATWQYTQSLRIYRCTADNSRRLRSYSANAYIGGFQSGTTDVGWNADKYGRRATDFTDLRDPFHTFLFTEEASPGDSGFTVIPVGDIWQSYPANFHRDGVNVSFVDGRVEYYRFSDARTARINQPRTTTVDNADLKQFQGWIGINLERFQPAGAGAAGK